MRPDPGGLQLLQDLDLAPGGRQRVGDPVHCPPRVIIQPGLHRLDVVTDRGLAARAPLAVDVAGEALRDRRLAVDLLRHWWPPSLSRSGMGCGGCPPSRPCSAAAAPARERAAP